MNIVVAMSGGVDSSVAAALLMEAGHRVIGVTLKLLKGETGFGCCGSTRDIDDARSVCGRLGAPHYVMDFSADFRRNIMEPFVDAYLAGETPNPCVACNRYVKFDALLKRAETLGADAVATGHYARVGREADGLHHLRRAVDLNKDQSYVLHNLGQGELARLMFPIGEMTKDAVRAAARRYGLKTADKAESMEICFVPRADTAGYVALAAQERGEAPAAVQPGPLVDTSGRLLGTHRGAAFYTRGQRQGLGVSVGKPLYVVDVDAPSNTVVVGSDAETRSAEAWVADAHWTLGRAPEEEFRALVQIRSRHGAAPARLVPEGEGVRVIWEEPQRAVTPGQAAVFYEGDEVIGGGTLRRALAEVNP
jgi:tRNA-specific 2-thiouridylase